MANLHFIKNVTHNGIQFLGRQIRNNEVVFGGMIIDLAQDVRGLAGVAQSLVDRKLAEFTTEPATHSSNFVNGAQEAVAVNAADGTGASPAADVVRQRENLQRQAQPAAPTAQPAPAAPAQPQTQAPAQASKQPTAEEVAAAAAAVA